MRRGPGGQRSDAQGRGPPVPRRLPRQEGSGQGRPDEAAYGPHRATGCGSGVGGRPERRAGGARGPDPGQGRVRRRGGRAGRPAARHPQTRRQPQHAAAGGDPSPARPAHRRSRPSGNRAAAAGVRIRPPRRSARRRPGRRHPGADRGPRLGHRPPQSRGDRPLRRRLRSPRRADPRTPRGGDDRGRLEDLGRRRRPAADRAGHQSEPRASRVRRRGLHARRPGRLRGRRPGGADRDLRSAGPGRRQRGRGAVPVGPRGLRSPGGHPHRGRRRVPQRGGRDRDRARTSSRSRRR